MGYSNGQENSISIYIQPLESSYKSERHSDVALENNMYLWSRYTKMWLELGKY